MVTVTTVGSRETPEDILRFMEEVGYFLAAKGIQISEGGAPGADERFHRGVEKYWKDAGYFPHLSRRIIPRDGFNNHHAWHGEHIYTLDRIEHTDLAMKIAEFIHPAWDKCSDFAKLLHSRNCYQVLGTDLLTPSILLFCWAKTSGNSIKGGTRTAWEIAKNFDIPCVNFIDPENVLRMKKLMVANSDRIVKRRPAKASEGITNIYREYAENNPTFKLMMNASNIEWAQAS